MSLALVLVACILFFIIAVLPPYDSGWPNRFLALGLFCWALSTVWGKF